MNKIHLTEEEFYLLPTICDRRSINLENGSIVKRYNDMAIKVVPNQPLSKPRYKYMVSLQSKNGTLVNPTAYVKVGRKDRGTACPFVLGDLDMSFIKNIIIQDFLEKLDFAIEDIIQVGKNNGAIMHDFNYGSIMFLNNGINKIVDLEAFNTPGNKFAIEDTFESMIKNGLIEREILSRFDSDPITSFNLSSYYKVLCTKLYKFFDKKALYQLYNNEIYPTMKLSRYIFYGLGGNVIFSEFLNELLHFINNHIDREINTLDDVGKAISLISKS